MTVDTHFISEISCCLAVLPTLPHPSYRQIDAVFVIAAVVAALSVVAAVTTTALF